MSILRQAPRLSPGAAADVARVHFGLTVQATPLAGERDQNFRLEEKSGRRYVLKVANAAEDPGFIAAENAALAHVGGLLTFCPRVVPASNGETVVSLAGGDTTHLARVLTWIDGVPLASVSRHSPLLLADVGRRVAELDAALGSFDHPAVHRELYWDLAGGQALVDDRAGGIQDADFRELIRTQSARIDEEAGAVLERLPRSVIHNDANDHNVLAAANRADPYLHLQRVAGIVDFGDMAHTWRIGGLAVAIAYFLLGKRDPLGAAGAVIQGYAGVLPLEPDEVRALFPLVKLRLCMSACIASSHQAERPHDAYLEVSQPGIRTTLPLLAALPAGAAERLVREACGTARSFAIRGRLIGPSVRLAYRQPLRIVRGRMQYLYDESGREYLDAYNNVPHVGHGHPRVVDAARRQMEALNTNTRYLYDAIGEYAERLVATMPAPLAVCYFLSSGSEANELALRLARTWTGATDLVVLDQAYHGHTTTLVDISPYKFNGPGGSGPAPWVHVAPVPDPYRGPHRSSDPHAGARYARAIGTTRDRLEAAGTRLAGFIAESWPSVAGQIVPPPGYLDAAYRHVRAGGGVCIADEVQTALGRIGTHVYAFETQGVVPDILVLGKPIGNGFPLAAVVTTREIAGAFDNGMEFFSTFGGSTVAGAVGLAVLSVLQEEGLQEHARQVGDHLFGGLRMLAERHEIVGDVRGSGLFLGVDLVRDRESRSPAGNEASYVANRLRDEGILIGTEGPGHNVLKIRPPMPFGAADADRLVETLDTVLAELSTPGAGERRNGVTRREED